MLCGHNTVGSEIFEVLAIILAIFLRFDWPFYYLMLVINSIRLTDYNLINVYEVMIFRLYPAYNKHEMIKIGNQI